MTAVGRTDPTFTVKGLSALVPWGQRAGSLPGAAPVPLPTVPGFAHSRFGPLVVAVANDCLARSPQGAAGDEATALILASDHGDIETLDGASQRLASDQPLGPLLFFQSAPTAALGHLSRAHGFLGPMACVSVPETDVTHRALTVADDLLGLDGIQDVLLVGVESAPNRRITRLEKDRPAGRTRAPAAEAAFALLLTRPAPDDGGLRLRTDSRGPVNGAAELGWLDGAIDLCHQGADLLRHGAGSGRSVTSSAGTLAWVTA